MTKKTRKVFMALVGAYLAYIGVNLVKSAVESQPKHTNMFVATGVFFAIFGLVTIILNIRDYLKENKAEAEESEASDEELPEAEQHTPDQGVKPKTAGAIFASVGDPDQESREEEEPEDASDEDASDQREREGVKIYENDEDESEEAPDEEDADDGTEDEPEEDTDDDEADEDTDDDEAEEDDE